MAIDSLGANSTILTAAGLPRDAPGIVSGKDAEALVTELTGLLGALGVGAVPGILGLEASCTAADGQG